jgi:putative glutamine amidotransferase
MRVAVTFGNEIRVGPYEDALRDAGIESVRNPESLFSLDGLLLTGGTDVNPVHYGQGRLRDSESPDDQRDALELRLVREALAADLPVLGICRGLQLLNVALDGSLIQHLPTTPVHQVRPKGAESGWHPAAHQIRVEPNTRLAEIIGAGEHEVNSRHHQAVDRLGRGLIVSARSEDGVVEGIEKAGAAFAVAVQWHPEDRVYVSEADRKLFEAFAAALATSLDEHRAARQPSS